MSTYVMSDFHGRHDFFMRMLEKIDFSENDTLYILGDVADRGPDGIKTFMYIMDKPNIVYLVGNHDLFLTDAYKRSLLVSDSESFYATREWMIWYYNGGLTTWSEFVKLDRTERRRIVSYIANAYVVIPNLKVGDRNFYLCHATHLDRYVDTPLKYNELSPKEREHVVWDRVYPRWYSKEFADRDYSELYIKYPKNTKMIFGHTPTALFTDPAPDGRCRIWHGGHGHLIDIDCGCAVREPRYAMLGCLRLDDLKEFYVHG